MDHAAQVPIVDTTSPFGLPVAALHCHAFSWVTADPSVVCHVTADPNVVCHVSADPNVVCHVTADPMTA